MSLMLLENFSFPIAGRETDTEMKEDPKIFLCLKCVVMSKCSRRWSLSSLGPLSFRDGS